MNLVSLNIIVRKFCMSHPFGCCCCCCCFLPFDVDFEFDDDVDELLKLRNPSTSPSDVLAVKVAMAAAAACFDDDLALFELAADVADADDELIDAAVDALCSPT